MLKQERNAWKQIGIGFACILLAGILGYFVTPWFGALALLGVFLIVGGWTDTTHYSGHPDNPINRNSSMR